MTSASALEGLGTAAGEPPVDGYACRQHSASDGEAGKEGKSQYHERRAESQYEEGDHQRDDSVSNGQ